MIIVCESKTIKEGEVVQNLPKGDYLAIQVLPLGREGYIDLSEFKYNYELGKRRVATLTGDPGIGTSVDTIQVKEDDYTPEFKELMFLLKEKLELDKEGLSEGEEIVIQANFGEFLELPWENIFEAGTPILRKVSVGDRDGVDFEKNNIVIALSHAHRNIGRSLEKEMNIETNAIQQAIIADNNQQYRVESISIIKHCTRESLGNINWQNFNIAHFIMHGDSDGGVFLEKSDPTRYKEGDLVSPNDFLDVLKGKNLKLVFLSLCYSGGGATSNCLAFQVVRDGLSRYTIGYSGKVGDTSARMFSEYFYKNLMGGKVIEKVYIEALSTYLGALGKKKKSYRPLLYMWE